jgi:large subunit ribosomal protein L6
MSRVGKLPVQIPDGVKVDIEKNVVKVTGPKGNLEWKFPRTINVKVVDGSVKVSSKGHTKSAKSMHGTSRALIFNMIKGVTEGWSKVLELVGVGYRASVSGNTLSLTVGFSHPVEIEAPEGITFKVEKSDITVEGIDKELVGLVSSRIRAVRPPEPYKGKGIKYKDEEIVRKAGKAAKATGSPA